MSYTTDNICVNDLLDRISSEITHCETVGTKSFPTQLKRTCMRDEKLFRMALTRDVFSDDIRTNKDTGYGPLHNNNAFAWLDEIPPVSIIHDLKHSEPFMYALRGLVRMNHDSELLRWIDENYPAYTGPMYVFSDLRLWDISLGFLEHMVFMLSSHGESIDKFLGITSPFDPILPIGTKSLLCELTYFDYCTMILKKYPPLPIFVLPMPDPLREYGITISVKGPVLYTTITYEEPALKIFTCIRGWSFPDVYYINSDGKYYLCSYEALKYHPKYSEDTVRPVPPVVTGASGRQNLMMKYLEAYMTMAIEQPSYSHPSWYALPLHSHVDSESSETVSVIPTSFLYVKFDEIGMLVHDMILSLRDRDNYSKINMERGENGKILSGYVTTDNFLDFADAVMWFVTLEDKLNDVLGRPTQSDRARKNYLRDISEMTCLVLRELCIGGSPDSKYVSDDVKNIRMKNGQWLAISNIIAVVGYDTFRDVLYEKFDDKYIRNECVRHANKYKYMGYDSPSVLRNALPDTPETTVEKSKNYPLPACVVKLFGGTIINNHLACCMMKRFGFIPKKIIENLVKHGNVKSFERSCDSVSDDCSYPVHHDTTTPVIVKWFDYFDVYPPTWLYAKKFDPDCGHGKTGRTLIGKYVSKTSVTDMLTMNSRILRDIISSETCPHELFGADKSLRVPSPTMNPCWIWIYKFRTILNTNVSCPPKWLLPERDEFVGGITTAMFWLTHVKTDPPERIRHDLSVVCNGKSLITFWKNYCQGPVPEWMTNGKKEVKKITRSLSSASRSDLSNFGGRKISSAESKRRPR